MTTQPENYDESDALAEEARREVSIEQRMRDAEENPGYSPSFTPEEADAMGFFIEEALTQEEAEDAMLDLLDRPDE